MRRRCSNREKNEWKVSSQAQTQSDWSFRKAATQGGYCLQHWVFYTSSAALKKHRASSFNKQHPGPRHQQQLPWVDTALDQCSIISPPFVPAYLISGRFGPHTGCKIQAQGKPSVRLRLAVALLTQRVKPDLKVKLKVEHLFKKIYLFLIEG